MTGTQLYDNTSNPITPITDAKSVSSGVIVTGNTVYDDISALLSRYQTLAGQVSGATTVTNSLGIIVEYSTNNFNNPTDAATANYGSVLVFPTAQNPYLWQKTVYKWGETVVKTTVGKLGDEVGVPASYTNGAADSKNNQIKWYTYPPQDISNTVPCAFIATRSRGANETWDGKEWHSAKYGQYPVQ